MGGFNGAEMERFYGPSYAKNPRAFKEAYGTQQELLEKQNELLAPEISRPAKRVRID